jgi:hypothetical protein
VIGAQCEYPQGNHLCPKAAVKETDLGKHYCEWHWHQVLVNREFLFALWERKRREKTLGYPDIAPNSSALG